MIVLQKACKCKGNVVSFLKRQKDKRVRVCILGVRTHPARGRDGGEVGQRR